MSSGLLKELQTACVNCLETAVYFNAAPKITVLAENIQDLEQEIFVNLLRLGIGVVVRTPLLEEEAIQGFSKIRLTTRILENVTINQSASGTQQGATKVAEAVIYHLNHYTPLGFSSCLRLERMERAADTAALAYDVHFHLQGSVLTQPQR